MLTHDVTALPELLETFGQIKDFSFDLTEGKKEIRRFVKPIKTGAEILML